MWGAFGWGLLAASSLVIGAVAAMLIPIQVRVIGLIMGFGAGVLNVLRSAGVVAEFGKSEKSRDPKE